MAGVQRVIEGFTGICIMHMILEGAQGARQQPPNRPGLILLTTLPRPLVAGCSTECLKKAMVPIVALTFTVW